MASLSVGIDRSQKDVANIIQPRQSHIDIIELVLAIVDRWLRMAVIEAPTGEVVLWTRQGGPATEIISAGVDKSNGCLQSYALRSR